MAVVITQVLTSLVDPTLAHCCPISPIDKGHCLADNLQPCDLSGHKNSKTQANLSLEFHFFQQGHAHCFHSNHVVQHACHCDAVVADSMAAYLDGEHKGMTGYAFQLKT